MRARTRASAAALPLARAPPPPHRSPLSTNPRGSLVKITHKLFPEDKPDLLTKLTTPYPISPPSTSHGSPARSYEASNAPKTNR